MRLDSARRLLSPRASGPCSGSIRRYSPQVARWSQPLRRRDSITWSAALALPPSRSTISARVASRRPRSVRASTTLLSCVDRDRALGYMSFPVMKPPKKGGFDEKYSNSGLIGQPLYVTKPPQKGGFVTQCCDPDLTAPLSLFIANHVLSLTKILCRLWRRSFPRTGPQSSSGWGPG